MSTYKLLVCYPTLPKDWEVGMEVGQGDGRGTFGDYSPCSGKYTDYRVGYLQVTEEPNFWEKMPEVSTEFEVLKWRFKGTTSTISTHKRGGAELEKNWEIFTVCRLSDGVYFSIGDTVKNPKLHSNQWFMIKGFTMDCFNEHLLALGGNGGIGIRKIEHYNAPLFKTHDGVEIFDGDEYLILFTDNNEIYNLRKARKGERITFTRPYLLFSSIELAIEYLDLNTPKYSIQDILDAVDQRFTFETNLKAIDLDKLQK